MESAETLSKVEQVTIDRLRVGRAVTFFREHFKDQPTLETAARHVHLSPWYFQRTFRRVIGLTPKQFLQRLALDAAKALLRDTNWSLASIALEMGLSGPSRLHDLFVKHEGMTPGQYRRERTIEVSKKRVVLGDLSK